MFGRKSRFYRYGQVDKGQPYCDKCYRDFRDGDQVKATENDWGPDTAVHDDCFRSLGAAVNRIESALLELAAKKSARRT